jgi:hypothetical protein
MVSSLVLVTRTLIKIFISPNNERKPPHTSPRTLNPSDGDLVAFILGHVHSGRRKAYGGTLMCSHDVQARHFTPDVKRL